MKSRIIPMVGLFAFFAVMSAFGQTPPIKVKIDFPFTVEGMTLPAGTYEFVRKTAQVFRVAGEGKDHEALAMIMTRLAAELHATLDDAHLVFDKVDGTYRLSEIWIPGEDGYMLAVTKGEHQHKVVNVKY